MQALVAGIDAGGAGGSLALYSTTRPSAGGTPGSVPMVVLPLAWPCGVVSGNTLVFTDSAFAQITMSGRALWGRICTSAGGWAADLDVLDSTTVATSPVIRLTDPQLYAGAFLALIGASIDGG